MEILEIKDEYLNERYFKVKHSSGLIVYIYPKEGYNSTYAIFGTNFGSINTKFKVDGEIIEVPDGIAHYLEHKLFESEDGDAFSKYAKTGAIANAYTSFDFTGYLFSCSSNFKESLEILIDFVQSPYFTQQTVQKEQGIIGQEIRMYDDDPDWRVMFNLFEALYHNHPIKIDIAGTVESIANITAEKLYQCYNAFYNLNNMRLTIVGDVNYNEVISILDNKLRPSNPIEVERIFDDEPYDIVKPRIEQQFEIAVPMFQLGFKEFAGKDRKTAKELVETEILLSIIASKASPLYNNLLEKNLINTSSFECEYFEGPGYASIIFSGESSAPDKTAELIKNEIKRLRKEGINKEAFEIAKKSVYGSSISIFNSLEGLSNMISKFSFAGLELFDYVKCISNAALDDVTKRFEEQFDCDNCVLSIISPLKK